MRAFPAFRLLPRSPRGAAVRATLLLALAAGITGPAVAEKADRNKPINVEADRMQYDDLKQINV
ncbi:MAG TPA: lipopolysaccharide transport periplasmic protein LptA, partial [Burkholderiaceae bacterium]|nr:lipopolysaccharide transport periplasmic protein LptA [Burkholderiaceae bacterium]